MQLRLITAVFAALATGDAATYLSETFDSIPQGTYTVAGSTIAVGPNFQLTSGSVDVLGAAYFPGLCVSPALTNCVDLNGMSPGTLVTSAVTLASGSYALTFVLNGSGPNRPLLPPNSASVTVTISAGALQLFNQTYTETNTETHTFFVPFTLVAPGSVTAQFASASPPVVLNDPNAPATGLILDNVTIRDFAVPEPSSCALCICAIAALAVRRVIRPDQ